MHAVRVEVRRMGGGFGGKESQGNAWLSPARWQRRATGGLARCAMTATMISWRSQENAMTAELIMTSDLMTGPDAGVEFTHYFRCGWALDLSLPVADSAMLHAIMPMTCRM